MEERLQKILARAGIASRRAAEELIRQGRVRVDGQVVTELGCKADPGRQEITCDNKPVRLEEEKVYLLLNKPLGYVTTLSDPQGRPIVSDLLKAIEVRVFPVGRLDIDTEGALILTNDGELAHQLLHPSFEITRTYEATVKGAPATEALHRLEEGILLEGRRTWPAKLRVLGARGPNTTIEITIHEGRKRQVRKMFAAIGHPVVYLKRTAYGSLRLGGLKPGKYRLLPRRELVSLFSKKKIS